MVPPQVAALAPGHLNSRAPHHQNVLDRAVGDRCKGLVSGRLEGRWLAAPKLPVRGDQQLGLGVDDPGLQGRSGEPAENNAMHDA
ncbi:Uncharacterised protein [Mycobacterium tuberculosis]|nr:Uncharacterised protein [Mycobacterium tuberculosis]CKU87685.1 Uncharacterised protein [Mycobacterium tuberculosis]CNL23521.1 Uncharacterised protein [Mycobacterium tuberculosis]CNL74046.1 Uncharacterised protein [Mycobacterium tuberculosis]CNL88732.1 Uncharacterised protein [Mycobacterium tuberculosis]